VVASITRPLSTSPPEAAPPFWRPLASYLEMAGRNRDAEPAWMRESLEMLERLARLAA